MPTIQTIIYIGQDDPHSTSYHRAQALGRLGYTVRIDNPYVLVSRLAAALHYRTGYRLLQKKMEKWVSDIIRRHSDADLFWVNSGELLGPVCLGLLRKTGRPIILYNNDDPTGTRDGNRFKTLLQALPLYDLCVVMRAVNVPEFERAGAKAVLRLTMGYDEVAHQPLEKGHPLLDRYRSEVAFLGTWMRHEQRDVFLMHLINAGIPVSIWGNRWHKSPYWAVLRKHHRGSALSGESYVAAVQGARICLGLLSKGNRDQHTLRTFEIPFIGGLLCAERTKEHQFLFTEGVDAVFWGDHQECIRVCRTLLPDTNTIARIKENGMDRVRALRKGNEDACRQIIHHLSITKAQPCGHPTGI